MGTMDTYEARMSDAAIKKRAAKGELEDYEREHYHALVEHEANKLRNKHFTERAFLVDIGIALAEDGLKEKEQA